MKLKEIIKIADAAYADGIVQLYFDFPNGHHGDTLAEFIASELKETFEESATDAEQVETAIDKMHSAALEIQAVIAAFELKQTELAAGG